MLFTISVISRRVLFYKFYHGYARVCAWFIHLITLHIPASYYYHLPMVMCNFPISSKLHSFCITCIESANNMINVCEKKVLLLPICLYQVYNFINVCEKKVLLLHICLYQVYNFSQIAVMFWRRYLVSFLI